MDYWTILSEGIANTSLLEWIAVISGILYVLLAAKKQNSCWFFALLSTGIYIYICYTTGLFIESWLQGFYFIMAIYGWVNWKKDESNNLPIQRWPLKYHLINIGLSGLVSFILGYFMSEYTSQNSPYLDAFTTVFSLAATFMVAKRVLENWFYWIVIDIALAFLYSSRELYLTGLHYVIFSVVAIFALISWYNYYKKQQID